MQGVEPRTLRIWAVCSNQLSYIARYYKFWKKFCSSSCSYSQEIIGSRFTVQSSRFTVQSYWFSKLQSKATSSFKIRCWTFDLPAMPLSSLGRMSWCLGPMTMIIPPSFVMHGRRVFDVHLLIRSMFIPLDCWLMIANFFLRLRVFAWDPVFMQERIQQLQLCTLLWCREYLETLS